MKTIHDSLFAHWNTDEFGNPISVQTTEQQKVSPIHLCIQLSQIPDQLHRLVVVDVNTDQILNEAFDVELLNQNSYKVDYNDGIVWFNDTNAGKTFEITYHGRGYKQIHAKRVVLDDGELLGVNTLHELIELNKEAVQSVMNINAEFDAKLEEVSYYAQLTKENMDIAYGTLYSDMENHVGDVIKFKNQSIASMKAIQSTFETEASKISATMESEFAEFNIFIEDCISKVEQSKTRALQTITQILEDFKTQANTSVEELESYKGQSKTSMDNKTQEVDTYKTATIDKMQVLLNNFKATLDVKNEEMQVIIDETMAKVHDLNFLFEGKQLQWQSEFNDAQLDKHNQFIDSMEAKDIDHETHQVNQQSDFDSNQQRQEETFQQAESLREQIFNEMKEIVYDENAVLNNKLATDKKVDTIEKEEVLELIRDENGNVTGSIGGQKLKFYTNKVDEQGNPIKQLIAEHLVSGKQSTYFGGEEPVDVEQIWFDPSDEDMENIALPQDANLKQFQDTINQIRDEVSQIKSAVKLDDLFAGSFFDEGSTSSDVDGNSATVNHLRIKVGKNVQLRQLKEGEMAYCSDTEKLYIGVRKTPVSTIIENRVIGGKQTDDSDSNSGNLTGEYLELDGKDGKKYRLFIDEDGVLKQRESEYLTAEPPKITDAGVGARFKGLIINRYYGGGTRDNGSSPLSHGFIELYNNSANGQTFNLKGLCIYYKTLDDGVWRRLPLTGYLPAYHSYLIRGARLNNPSNSSCRHEIKYFDQHWDMVFSSNSAMVYLGVDNGEITVANPFYLNDGTQMAGYIDLLATSSENEKRSLNALEYDITKAPYYRKYIGAEIGVQRIDFKDTNNAYVDYEPVNYRTCDINIYRPRCVEDGKWDLYYNKTKLNENIPNLLNIQYGKEWHTRTFTWQSKVMERGFLKYRKVGEAKWNFIDTNTEIVYHADQDCTIHRCIIRNLEEGFYEYQAGDEGCWSDINVFEVKSYQTENGEYDTNQHIKFLQVSDQQSFYESDYEAWRWAVKYIEDNEKSEDYDFVVNTGDISQSGSRSFEWRSYWKHPRFLKEKVHMLTCGNNDLVDKIYSYCFKYYDTVENDFIGDKYQPNAGNHSVVQGTTPHGKYASCHSYDLGYAHFVVMNSCAMESMEDKDIIVKQMNWIRQDIQEARMRPNPPRWYILCTHYGAFTVCRMKMPQQLVPFVEDLGFHVVMCGHHHTYSRSTPIKMNIREEVERITGHDLYDVYDGCGTAISNAVYSIGYLESFKNAQGVTVLPKGVTHDQSTVDGTLANGSLGVVSNGNEGSRQAYVNPEQGTYWVMCQATGSKLKSNKDMEKSPTPWYYGWCKYSEETGYSNHPHPYKPSYLMWDIGYDSISVKAYALNGIVEFDEILKDAVVINPDKMDYSKVTKEVLDSFEIPYRKLY